MHQSPLPTDYTDELRDRDPLAKIAPGAPPLFYALCACGRLTPSRRPAHLRSDGWLIDTPAEITHGMTLPASCPRCHPLPVRYELTCTRCHTKCATYDLHALCQIGWSVDSMSETNIGAGVCDDCNRRRHRATRAALARRAATQFR